MAHRRKSSTTEGQTKAPHLVSLKVLRLSRPRLAQQYPIPQSGPGSKYPIPVKPSLSLPLPTASTRTSDEDGADVFNDEQFTLTPLLGLPPAFGSTYVGETFACALCANNELRGEAAERQEKGSTEASEEATGPGKMEKGHAERRSVTGVRMSAEMQTPANPGGIPLRLAAASSTVSTSSAAMGIALDENDGTTEVGLEQNTPVDLEPGGTLQRTAQFELREQGTHYLAITLTYNEHQREEGGGGQVIGARVRSFRKLYQFVAQTLLGVRTKAGEVAPTKNASRKKGIKGEGEREDLTFALEAQVENFGDVAVVLEGAEIHPRSPFISRSLNWDADLLPDSCVGRSCPILNPRDVMQLAFVLKQTNEPPTSKVEDDRLEIANKSSMGRDEKKSVALGQLSIQWRGPMGEKGSLTTGWLTAQKA